MGALKITQSNFDSEVLKSNIPVLIDFWAEWCGPCRMIAPVIEEISKEMAATLKVGKVNVDEEQELAVKYNVMSIPMMIVFKNGKVANQFVGAMSKDQLISKIKPNL